MVPPNQSNVVSRRTLLQGIAAFSTTVLFSGCNQALSVSTSSAPATTSAPAAVANPQPTPTGLITQATLNISSGSSGSIGSGFAGLSYEKADMCEQLFSAANTDLIGLFRLLGPSVLRIGGGSVDQCVWNEQGPGRTSGQIAPSDVAALAAFVKAAGWQCIYGVNLGGAATGATTPELAAAEVACAAQEFGSALIGIEIGNECDGYGATGSYFAGDWSLAQFETLWSDFRSSILARTPGVNVTGPASAGNESTWTVPFGKAITGSNMSLLTQHYYRGNGQSASATAANLLAPDTTLGNYLSILNSGANAAGVPFRMGECNSYYDGGAPGVSDSYASALWVLDFLFNCAQGGAAGVNFHGGGDSACYSPVSDNGATVTAVNPIFYGITMFTMANTGDLLPATVSAGSLNVTAYAVKTSNGGLNLIVVNKDATHSLQMMASLPQQAGTATLMTMSQLSDGASAPSLAATDGVTIQGTVIDANGGFEPSAAYNLSADGSGVSFYVPALSAVLIQVQA